GGSRSSDTLAAASDSFDSLRHSCDSICAANLQSALSGQPRARSIRGHCRAFEYAAGRVSDICVRTTSRNARTWRGLADCQRRLSKTIRRISVVFYITRRKDHHPNACEFLASTTYLARPHFRSHAATGPETRIRPITGELPLGIAKVSIWPWSVQGRLGAELANSLEIARLSQSCDRPRRWTS